MKPLRRIVLVVVLMAGAVIAFRLWRVRDAQKQKDYPPEQTSNGPAVTADSPASPLQVQGTRQSLTSWVGEVFDGRSKVRKDFDLLNTRKIDFYGRVVDQFNRPVAGAVVKAAVLYRDSKKSGQRRVEAITDQQGQFAFEGLEGEGIGIQPERPGYRLATEKTYFSYTLLSHESPHRSDAKNPVTFTLWLIQNPEPLHTISYNIGFPCCAMPARIDFATGDQTSSHPNFIVRVERSNGDISEREPKDWRFSLQVPDGGLIETDPTGYRRTFMAPSDGYSPSLDYSISMADQTWCLIWQKWFFVKLDGGKCYGKGQITVRINEHEGENVGLSVNGLANTNSSRNWEASQP